MEQCAACQQLQRLNSSKQTFTHSRQHKHASQHASFLSALVISSAAASFATLTLPLSIITALVGAVLSWTPLSSSGSGPASVSCLGLLFFSSLCSSCPLLLGKFLFFGSCLSASIAAVRIDSTEFVPPIYHLE